MLLWGVVFARVHLAVTWGINHFRIALARTYATKENSRKTGFSPGRNGEGWHQPHDKSAQRGTGERGGSGWTYLTMRCLERVGRSATVTSHRARGSTSERGACCSAKTTTASYLLEQDRGRRMADRIEVVITVWRSQPDRDRPLGVLEMAREVVAACARYDLGR